MLDLDTAISLMKKYGYTSTSVHPYIYKTGDIIGVCYSFIDDQYGVLERVALFRTSEEMDDFLKKMQWFKVNGKQHNVVMKLDDYEGPSPNIIYVRNGRIMASDEMFNLEKYDNIERQKKELNEVERYVLESSKLMDYYNARKDEQSKFAAHVNELQKIHKQKYYDLQILIDKYNKTSHDRKVGNLDVKDAMAGINISMERALKERLSQYKSNPPEKNEAIEFIHEVWNLCNSLEVNKLHHENKVYESNIISDTKHGEKKIEFMKSIVDSKNFFTKDLVNEFKKIDTELSQGENVLTDEYITRAINQINQKYSYYDKLDCLKVSDYLQEALTNTNYPELSLKYTDKLDLQDDNIILDYEKIIEKLKESFKGLSILEQNSLILYFSEFGKLLNLIQQVPGYASTPKATLIAEMEKDKNYKDLKNRFFDSVKVSVDLSSNEAYKKSLFASYDFSSMEAFLDCCINTINIVKNIKGLKLNSDVDVFYITSNYEQVSNVSVIDTNVSVATLNGTVKDNEKVVLATIKKGSSVLYSPRIIDFGDYSVTAKYSIKERSEHTISFSKAGIRFANKEQPIVVSKYSSKAIKEGDISIVDKLLLSVKNNVYITELNNSEVNPNEK